MKKCQEQLLRKKNSIIENLQSTEKSLLQKVNTNPKIWNREYFEFNLISQATLVLPTQSAIEPVQSVPVPQSVPEPEPVPMPEPVCAEPIVQSVVPEPEPVVEETVPEPEMVQQGLSEIEIITKFLFYFRKT